jgi:hypothetical protein
VGVCAKFARISGGAGLKATKAEIIRLAQLVKKDIARGRVAANAEKAADILADYSNTALDLLELALEEAAKKRSNEPLFWSFGFLFGQALETLRHDIESGYQTASDIAASVRKRLVAASRSEAADPSAILFLVQTFSAAKLDLGEELQGVVERVLQEGDEEGGETEARHDGPADLSGFVAELVKQTDGDAFALFSRVAESSGGVPDEYRAVLAATFLDSGEAVAMEACIGWLLDPAASVRQGMAGALEEAARGGKVTPTMLCRMIAMRNWLPEESRPALDAAIAAARRNGASPAQWEAVEVRQLVTTGIDGSGAIGVLGHCRNKRKGVLASLVLKQGIGVRDAWVQEGMTQREIDRALLEVSSINEFMIAPDFIRRTVGHFLALGHQTGSMPPFGLVRFLEAVGVSSVQPELISAASLLDTIEEGRAIGADAFEHLLADSIDLPDDYFFVESWFEAGDKVDAVLKHNRGSHKKREAIIMEKVLEPRREWWVQKAAWAAYILYRAEDKERWQEFHAAASAMLQGRALGEIGLMVRVAAQTVRAWEDRRNG